jgi:hypothetical protein
MELQRSDTRAKKVRPIIYSLLHASGAPDIDRPSRQKLRIVNFWDAQASSSRLSSGCNVQ